MKILIDLNLSPEWVSVLKAAGHEAVHWSHVGESTAPDTEILSWAKAHGYVMFTHDLDFGTILAATRANAPSVFQIRTQDVTPQAISDLVLSALNQFREQLLKGALISIDEDKSRARILPLSQ
jgi:predicted nuclease of predicted toxin-antitoxin system